MEIVHVTKDNYHEVVEEAQKRVLLDFWAPWCGPCRMVAPVLEQIAAEREDVLVCKVNVDEEMELAGTFRIASIPTLVVLDGGKVIATAVGYRPKADIISLLDS